MKLAALALAAIGLTTSAICGPATASPARPPLASVSHLAVYSADLAKSEAFYVHELGAARLPDPENPRGVRYYFNPRQFVEVLPLPAGEHSINRLDHAAFITPDAEAMRAYLASKHIQTPAQVMKGRDGSRWFDVKDPEGITIQFLQPPPNGPAIPPNHLSNHLIHFGFIVHNRAREDAFYMGVLGFKPYWAGGMKDDKPTWISLQMPEGRDWMEYMIVGKPDGRGIPPDMKQETLGVLNHFALGINNAEAAYTLLWNGGRLGDKDQLPKIGRDAKWQLNLIDPDGTRAELMEFHAIGKPCCTPFGAPGPDR